MAAYNCGASLRAVSQWDSAASGVRTGCARLKRGRRIGRAGTPLTTLRRACASAASEPVQDFGMRSSTPMAVKASVISPPARSWLRRQTSLSGQRTVPLEIPRRSPDTM
jgi:hypothetical protein